MIYISHRGNIDKKDTSKENTPEYITSALNSGWDVEIDVWLIGDYFFLGHDAPTAQIDENFLLQNHLWIHAKNIDALNHLRLKTNCFFHDRDDVVLTSHFYLWTYPGKQLTPNSIAVLPETINDIKLFTLKKAHGICSDIIGQWKKKLSKGTESND
jgi:hypothetical protein